ncbi:Hypothetical protein NTJ_11167 [Nesidiocoris tenuis]|uniref:Uncharacterized protein n=1 Tax=Nesidiocoris tenuis TaxID=355587 RepID=A0ABN7B1Q4_9HEMI|nr:Hypothetical protein NTJ_11167 [Nesidiocoris tenuis]
MPSKREGQTEFSLSVIGGSQIVAVASRLARWPRPGVESEGFPPDGVGKGCGFAHAQAPQSPASPSCPCPPPLPPTVSRTTPSGTLH